MPPNSVVTLAPSTRYFHPLVRVEVERVAGIGDLKGTVAALSCPEQTGPNVPGGLREAFLLLAPAAAAWAQSP